MDKPTRFVGDDDQKNIDELVAVGIQVDKELIARLKAELQEAYSLIGGIVLAVGAPIEGDLGDWVEALRKDAARHQWLRSRLPGSAYRVAGVIYSEGGDGVDAGIDAAMSKEAGHE